MTFCLVLICVNLLFYFLFLYNKAMKKIFDYIALALLAGYASLPFIPVYHFHTNAMLYDPDVGDYVPKVIDEWYRAIDNFPGAYGNVVLGIILFVLLYSLIGITTYFFIKDFKNDKKRKWIPFAITSVFVAVFMISFIVPRGA